MKPKVKSVSLEFPPKRNPSGHVPHVIDWDRVSADMESLIDRHRELYQGIADGTIPLEGDDDDYGVD